jgi:pimeloyl-ACP methyl ester carboxylesterase
VRCAAAIALLTFALAGCGGHAAAHRQAGPALATVCGSTPTGLKATTSWLQTSDGVRVFAAEAGSGTTAVVLAHESPGGLCGWLPAMRHFEANGIRTLAFDFRGFSPSDSPPLSKYDNLAPDLQAAVDAVRADGATKVVVMGASFGGAATLTEGWKLHGVDSIISLSGELNLPARNLDALQAVPKLRVPLLVIASRDDPYLDASDARKLMRAAGSTDQQLIVYPGVYHGWDLLDLAPFRARVWAALGHWIADH